MLHGFAEAEAVHRGTDRDAANEVDERDQDRRDRVALDKLRRTVHRAVELRLLLDLLAALACLVFGDLAGVEIGVDRHLLTGHGVEGEASCDLGDTTGTCRDDHELDHDQD